MLTAAPIQALEGHAAMIHRITGCTGLCPALILTSDLPATRQQRLELHLRPFSCGCLLKRCNAHPGCCVQNLGSDELRQACQYREQGVTCGPLPGCAAPEPFAPGPPLSFAAPQQHQRQLGCLQTCQQATHTSKPVSQSIRSISHPNYLLCAHFPFPLVTGCLILSMHTAK